MERELRCKRCNQYVPISSMKYEKTGTYLVCPKCRGEEKEPRKAPVKPLTGHPFEGTKIFKYQCPSCRYVFRRTTTHAVEKCPNCANSKLIKYEKVSADDILKMSEDKRFRGL